MYAARSGGGYTIVEALVGVGIFMVITTSAYQAYLSVLRTAQASRLKIAAIGLANEQFEILRNLPYEKVGVVSGVPSGVVPHTQTLVRDGTSFNVVTTIRNIDDPFDGTISGTPNDSSPADYKLAEIGITCPTCKDFAPISFTTHIAPRNLESTSANGALFVHVFDAAGKPVSGAQIHIENSAVQPPIVIDDTTNNDGILQLVDIPPGVEAYQITASKSGYSTDRTYPSGASGNPNPVKPHATVVAQKLTQISFSIDRTSTLTVDSVTPTCGEIPSIDFSLSGSKLIGTNPDKYKYDEDLTTDGSGTKTIPGLEWDTYGLSLTDLAFDLAGTIPLFPLTLNPNGSQNSKLVVEPKDPRGFLVTVKDASTQLPLSGADVRLEKAGYDITKTTGRGFIRQTDWSGGPGQDDYADAARFFSSSGSIDTNTFGGEIQLREVFGEYESSGSLTSSTFDTGSASNFHQILWQPINQPAETGGDSVRFQIATNNDKTTWNFHGPDGTQNTYYTPSDQNINFTDPNDRYLRYRVFLQTASTTWTPRISDVSFTFTSSCVPPGQVFFAGLGAGAYTLTVSKAGYQAWSDITNITLPWQQREVTLSP